MLLSGLRPLPRAHLTAAEENHTPLCSSIFGRLLADYACANQFIQRERDFSSRFVEFRSVRNDYALYVVLNAVDTVGVWGSNPHAPTNPLKNFRRIRSSNTLHLAI